MKCSHRKAKGPVDEHHYYSAKSNSPLSTENRRSINHARDGCAPRLERKRGAGAARTIWQKRIDRGNAGAVVEEVPRTISGCSRHRAPDCDVHFSWALAV